jgi:oxygen-independent coproporphyrinogen-3 oxidase
MITALPPLSLYVHLPWCVQKCPYCDFNSHTAGAGTNTVRYVHALIADLRREATGAAGRTIENVFLGGGTPSFFSPAEIGRLLAAVRTTFRLASDAEITMEANPGALERGRLRDYRAAGVNRLSLGAQSFNDESLRRLGRIHSAEEIHRAWRDAREAGFDSVNLDLMYALPGQTLSMAAADMREALELAPEHLSWYQLTLEPNTRFHAAPPAELPDEDLCFEVEECGHALLAEAGYEQYEVSAFARPGYRCRHNMNYWLFGDYVGVGAGAHGKLSRVDGGTWRTRKTAHPRLYMEQMEAGFAGHAPQRIGEADLAFEYMLNALRLTDGFTEAAFAARTGLPLAVVLPKLERACRLGLMAAERDGCWKPSLRGRRFLNDLQGMFLPDQGVDAALATAGAA